MKLAIIGPSPLALEAALRFHAHEAALTWFNEGENIASLFASPELTWSEASSERGWAILKETGHARVDQDPFSWERWHQAYFLPLSEFLKTCHEVRSYPVVAVTKRYLAQGEEIRGRSRFYDLFRVIYQLNPQDFIHQQKDLNQETFQRLSQEVMESLQSHIEMYEDFDLVMDFRYESHVPSLSVTGRALGEKRISADYLHYGAQALCRAKEILTSETRELALVGSGDLAAEVVIQLGSWMKDLRNRLFIITHEENPFATFLQEARPECTEKLLGVLKAMEDDFKQETQEFLDKLRQWQGLDDFVQVKIPRPVEPIPRLVFFSGHNASAIDQLIDRRRIFLTLEKPDFREGHKQPENNHIDLKTIGVDEVLVANTPTFAELLLNFRSDEKGLFQHGATRPMMNKGWEKDHEALNKIEEEVFKLFAPSNSSELQ